MATPAPDIPVDLYHELRKIAKALMAREKPGITIQATALVHDAYLRMLESYPDLDIEKDRRGFMRCTAEVMRRTLVDQARKRKATIRGGDREREEYYEAEIVAPQSDFDVEELSEALDQLEQEHPTAVEVVKLIYFVGLTKEEIADLFDCSESTVRRDLTYALAWLRDFLKN